MKKGQEWTNEQLLYLKEHYPFERAEDVGNAIGKSKNSVQHKANRLGIGKDAEKFREVRSNACSGERSGNFKGYRRKTKRGYILLYMPEHPNASKNGLIMEHRVIMEQHLGIIIPKEFAVHHINGIKDDNRIENLSVMTNSAHSAYHNRSDKKQKNGEKNPLYKKIEPAEIMRLREIGYTVKRVCTELGIKKTKYYSVLRGA